MKFIRISNDSFNFENVYVYRLCTTENHITWRSLTNYPKNNTEIFNLWNAPNNKNLYCFFENGELFIYEVIEHKISIRELEETMLKYYEKLGSSRKVIEIMML